MDDARFNVFWFLSLLAPAALMLCASLGRKIWISLLVGAGSVALTYWLCLLAVVRKWDMYAARATTDAERQAVYDSDGGNQAFTAVITGPIEAIGYTVLWGVIGWKLISMYQQGSSNTSLERTRER